MKNRVKREAAVITHARGKGKDLQKQSGEEPNNSKSKWPEKGKDLPPAKD